MKVEKARKMSPIRGGLGFAGVLLPPRFLPFPFISQVEKTAYKLSVSRSGARRSYRPNRRLTRCGSAAAVLSG